MKYLRTPDSCFENVIDYNFPPHYKDVDDGEGGKLRVHYIDEGDANGETVLLMHGEPSWSFLYRKMVGPLVQAGHRVIAVDLVGFGRSDKPSLRSDYSYARHVSWMLDWFDQMKFNQLTLVCQDWGGLIGLRLVAARPDRFARVVTANTALPTGNSGASEAFVQWQKFSQEVPEFPTGDIINGGCTTDLSREVIDAYNAPYPDESYKEGARQFPLLVPTSTDDPEHQANVDAWKILATFEQPWLTAFSDSDPITKGGDKVFQTSIPGAKNQRHTTIKNGGHFLQEDAGEQLAAVTAHFIKENPLP